MRFPALLVVVGLLLAGCADGDDTTSTAPVSASPSESPSPSASPSTVPTTAASTASAAFVAADGRNLRACADNTCEVIVQSGDVLRVRGNIGPLHIQVTNSEVTIWQSAPDGSASTVTGSVGTQAQINNQAILIEAVEKTRAVLRLQPA